MSATRTARLIITFDCPRHCEGCCNHHSSLLGQAKTVTSLEQLRSYQAVCITGGEPLLHPEYTRDILEALYDQDQTRPLFLYTALYNPALSQLLPLLSGVHFSLHAGATGKDVYELESLQALAAAWPNKSWRLFVDRRVVPQMMLIPQVWTRVEIKPWLAEGQCPLPAHEDLLILKKAA